MEVKVETQADRESPNWYDRVEDGSVRQGDIFRAIPAVWPADTYDQSADFSTEPVRIDCANATLDAIVISASCDIANPKYPYSLLARVVDAEVAVKATGDTRLQRLEVLRQGLVPNQFLLPDSGDAVPKLGLSVVHHKVHIMVPTEALRRMAQMPRLRLRSPMREKFGQWVGACFARIGLEAETEIGRFVSSVFAPHVLDAQEPLKS